MWLVCLCAFLCILQSALTDGGLSVLIAFTSLLSAVLTEFLLTFRKHGITKIIDGSAAATAMILAMLLPNQINPVFVFFAAAFSIAVVKYSFGGLGSNWLNPALGGWLLIRFSWPDAFRQINESVTSITDTLFIREISSLDNSITDFLNSSVFSVTGVQLPSGYIDLLFFNGQGIITDRGLFALLIGTIIITAVKINRGWVSLVFLFVYGLLIRFAGDVNGIYWNGDMLYGIFTGGTIAAAFVIAAEPSSGAKLKPGILFNAVLAAVLSWFFRYRCMEFSGCFIALAITNCFTPLVRIMEEKIISARNNFGKNKDDANTQQNKNFSNSRVKGSLL